MHRREAVLGDLELDAAGGVAVDEVDEVPWDDAGGEAAGEAFDGGGGEALEEAAGGSAEADLDLGDAEGEAVGAVEAGLPDEIDVVDADDAVTIDVDDLLVHQVAVDEEVGFIIGTSMGWASLRS